MPSNPEWAWRWGHIPFRMQPQPAPKVQEQSKYARGFSRAIHCLWEGLPGRPPPNRQFLLEHQSLLPDLRADRVPWWPMNREISIRWVGTPSLSSSAHRRRRCRSCPSRRFSEQSRKIFAVVVVVFLGRNVYSSALAGRNGSNLVRNQRQGGLLFE